MTAVLGERLARAPRAGDHLIAREPPLLCEELRLLLRAYDRHGIHSHHLADGGVLESSRGHASAHSRRRGAESRPGNLTWQICSANCPTPPAAECISTDLPGRAAPSSMRPYLQTTEYREFR